MVDSHPSKIGPKIASPPPASDAYWQPPKYVRLASRRFASYWNVFLFFDVNLFMTELKILEYAFGRNIDISIQLKI